MVGDDSQRKKRKVQTCKSCGKIGHNSRNRLCENYTERIPIPRENVETSRVHVSPVQNVQEDEGNDDENDVENDVEPEDDVLDDIDIDDGLGNEEQTNGNWVETDFLDAGALPRFDHYCGANIVQMRENRCFTCIDLFACYFDDECLRKFVTASENFGRRHFGSKWKTLDVNEFKTFLASILVLGLIPVTSRDSAWGYNGLGIPLCKRLISKARFNQILRAWRYYEDESELTQEQINRNAKDCPFWYVKGYVDTLRNNKFQEMFKLGQHVDIHRRAMYTLER